MKIKIKKLRDNAVIPTRGSAGSAGYDLCACLENNILIAPGEVKKIPTGLAVEIPAGYFGGIFARSGMASKEGLRPANCVGVCDEDYRGEYIVPLYNDSQETREIASGQKIAQLIILPYMQADFQVVDELEDSARGAGGFGSTGK